MYTYTYMYVYMRIDILICLYECTGVALPIKKKTNRPTAHVRCHPMPTPDPPQ